MSTISQSVASDRQLTQSTKVSVFSLLATKVCVLYGNVGGASTPATECVPQTATHLVTGSANMSPPFGQGLHFCSRCNQNLGRKNRRSSGIAPTPACQKGWNVASLRTFPTSVGFLLSPRSIYQKSCKFAWPCIPPRIRQMTTQRRLHHPPSSMTKIPLRHGHRSYADCVQLGLCVNRGKQTSPIWGVSGVGD